MHELCYTSHLELRTRWKRSLVMLWSIASMWAEKEPVIKGASCDLTSLNSYNVKWAAVGDPRMNYDNEIYNWYYRSRPEQVVEIISREYQPSRLTTVDDLLNILTHIYFIVQKYF